MGQQKPFNAPSGQTGGSPQLVAVIRDAIVRAILDGTYPRGARLPTNPQIQEHWKVSARTSRKVLALLTQEGWAIAEGTRGYTSTGGPDHAHPATGARVPDHDATAPDTTNQTPRQPDTPSLPQPAPAPAPALPPAPAPIPRPVHTVPLGADIPAALSAVHLLSVAYEPAPPETAHALHLDGPGLPVLVRRRLITDPTGTIPLELRTSYTPGVSERCPLAQPDILPGTWCENLATHTPHRPATGTTQISTRPAEPYEVPALQLHPGAYVLVRITTRHTTAGHPADQTVSVWPDTTTIQAETHPLT